MAEGARARELRRRRAHFESKGLPTGRHYLPTLLFRYAAEGVVAQTSHGRYRVNRDHPDLVGV